MAKRIQDFRNFDSSKEVAASKTKHEVATKPKKITSKSNKKNTVSKSQKQVKEPKNKIIMVFFIVLIMTGVIVGCLFSPTFNLEEIIVNDGENITSQEIRKSFDITMGINIFKIDCKKIKNSIESLPYIKSASVKLELPREVRITYVEREPFALIKYLESYLVMDKYGYILEISRKKKFVDLPIIYNINFDSFEIGKQLDDTAKTKYDNVVYLIENAKQSNFEYEISEINYESVGNVKIWVTGQDIEIIYGEIDRSIIIDKLNYISKIISALSGKKGKLDASSGYYLNKTVFAEIF